MNHRAHVRRAVASSIALVLAAACAPRQPGAADPAVLMSADSAFDAQVAERGSEAWVEWFAEDGAMVQEGVGEIRGREAIRVRMAGLDRPGTSLRWTPLRAEIATSGDLGWTTGRYVSESRQSDGSVVRGEGRYVSIWRRSSDGTWRVVMDLGNPTGPPPTP